MPRKREEQAVKKSKFSDEQIAFAIKQVDNGTSVAEVCRKFGICEATFYLWKRTFSGMGVAELRRLRQLEDENRRLKRLMADPFLDKEMLQEVLRKTV